MSFIYKDGAEQKLLEIFSDDNFNEDTTWKEHTNSWALLYHLSPLRKNLLKWINFKKEGVTVLELGAGCGAITSGLCQRSEITRHVAIEGSSSRANLVKERCKKFEHLEVINCNFEEYKTDEKFDFVFIIGALEYSGRYIDDESPYQKFLDHASSYLKPDGVLVLAIENQLGHKYIAGFNEDHYGKPYVGLSNYQEDIGIRTFDKPTLSKMLEQSGLPSTQYFYPFPDYKLPNYIISEKAIGEKEFNFLDAIEFPTIDNSHHHTPNFNEKKFLELVQQVSDIGNFMNSFLIFASKNKIEDPSDFLLAKFNNHRHLNFQTSKFFKLEEGKIVVITEGEKKSKEQYYSNHFNLAEALIDAYISKNDKLFKYYFEVWNKTLNSFAVENTNNTEFSDFSKRVLKNEIYKSTTIWVPSNCLDLIPNNILISKDTGEVVIIDQEWDLEVKQIPLKLVIDRGILYILSFVNKYQVVPFRKDAQWNVPVNLSSTETEYCDFKLFEYWFQQKVSRNIEILSETQKDTIIKKETIQAPIVKESNSIKHVVAHKLSRLLSKIHVIKKFAQMISK